MRCPDCGSGRRADGYNREGWYWLECSRRFNPERDSYGPPTPSCRRIILEATNKRLKSTVLQLCREYDVGCWNTVHQQIGEADFGGDCGNKPISKIWRGIPICEDCEAT